MRTEKRSNAGRPSGRLIAIALALLSAGAGSLKAQPQDLPARVRGLNNRVLQLHGRTRGATPATVRGFRGEANSVLRERAAAMSELIEKNPKQALELALSAEALAEVAGAFPESADLLETQGEWEGPVEYIIIDDENFQTAETLIRMNGPEGTFDIHFAGTEPGGMQSGDTLQVSGIKLGGQVAAETAMVTAAAVTACGPTGEQRIAVLMITYPGVAPPAISAQQVSDALKGTSGRTLDGYWREGSYGKTWVGAADVYGWYTLDAQYTCDQTSQIRTAAIAAADPFVNFQNYNRVFILMPNLSSCGWAGLAQTGCPSLTSADGTSLASTAWLVPGYFSNRDQAVHLTAHEGGHNLGLMHSRTRDFGAESISSLGIQGTLSEYGDPFATMGSWNIGHYNAQHKVQVGFQTAGTNSLTVQAPGTFYLQPTENATAGLQSIKVQRGTGNNSWLWVEYRQPIGNYDATLPSQVFSGALIHYNDSYSGTFTDLVDFTGSTSSFSDAALAAGQTWVDPYSNVSLTVGAPSNGSLPVTVNYGPLPCITAAPKVTVSPLNPSLYPDQSMNYGVTITNNDSAGCPSSTYTLSSSQPSGWPASFTVGTLGVTPGATASATWKLTVPAGTSPATYATSVSAMGGAVPGSAAFNCTVVTPPPSLTVTLSLASTTYGARDNVPVTATVVNGTALQSGANVSFTITKPNGTKSTGSATTGSNGKATWSYRLGPKDSKGVYSVGGRASYGSQSGDATAVQFTVQ